MNKQVLKASKTVSSPDHTASELQAGKELLYAVERKAFVPIGPAHHSKNDPFATWSEWESDADIDGYYHL